MSFILRSSSVGSAIPSNRVAALASSMDAAIRSLLRSAAMRSVSSVMKLACTQAARPALVLKSSSRSSAASTKARASSAVGRPPAWARAHPGVRTVMKTTAMAAARPDGR